MKNIRLSVFLLLLLAAFPGWAQVVEERTTVVNGVYETCGVGEGLAPCRDINGETYEEEIAGPDVEAETNSELADQAAKIRNESPEELLQTITEMENDAY